MADEAQADVSRRWWELSKTYFQRKARNVRHSARSRGLEVHLSQGNIRYIFALYAEGCPMCGNGFIYERWHNGNLMPHRASPTFDRIDPDEGYVVGNVQLLCSACNKKKNRDVELFMPIQPERVSPFVEGLWLHPELIEDIIDGS